MCEIFKYAYNCNLIQPRANIWNGNRNYIWGSVDSGVDDLGGWDNCDLNYYFRLNSGYKVQDGSWKRIFSSNLDLTKLSSTLGEKLQ
jgi:hypothetical protein